MRPDMKYVVIERPRRGGHSARVRRPRRPGDEMDGYAKTGGMSRNSRTYSDHKELSDHLNPLYRYLDKQEGRPWNDVYSEMSQSLDRRSVQGFHVWSHVEDYVEMHVEIIDGVPFEKKRSHTYSDTIFEVHGLYIDPHNGILKKRGNKYPRYYGPRNPKPDDSWKIRSINPTERLEWINGLWYRVTLGVVQDTEEKTVYHWDKDGNVTEQVVIAKKKGDVVPIDKKQLNKKELKEHGVRNGHGG